MSARAWAFLLELCIERRAPAVLTTIVEGRWWAAVLRERGVRP
jgi:hypothetical protein